MKLSLTIIPLLLVTISANANLKKLSNEFLGTNSELRVEKDKVLTSTLDAEIQELSRSWDLSLESSLTDSQLKSSSTLSQYKTESWEHTASLSKEFAWGGTLSVSSQLDSDASTSTTSLVKDSFAQTISYTQEVGANFFGRNTSLNEDIAWNGVKVNKANLEGKVESSLLGFVGTYTSAKLNKTVIELQKQALKRAISREKLIGKRVRDGLREKVDLYSSQIARISQQEALSSAESSFRESLDKLSSLLHRQVGSSEIEMFNLKELLDMKLPKGNVDTNKSLKAISESMLVIEKQLAVKKNEVLPTVKLFTNYSTNEYGASASDVFSDGNIGSDNNALELGLSVTWSIGSSVDRRERDKKRIGLKTAQYRLEKEKFNLLAKEGFLQERVTYVSKNLKSVDERYSLAKKSLKEYNRLYNRGRVSFEQVIRSEEDLISTERNFANYLAERDHLVWTLAYLYGELNNYIK